MVKAIRVHELGGPEVFLRAPPLFNFSISAFLSSFSSIDIIYFAFGAIIHSFSWEPISDFWWDFFGEFEYHVIESVIFIIFYFFILLKLCWWWLGKVLRWEDVEIGEPKEGEIRVRNKAIGLNFVDVYFRKGVYKAPTIPFTPGSVFFLSSSQIRHLICLLAILLLAS